MIVIVERGPIGEWLNRKWMDWERTVGERKSQAEFADYLGIDRIALNQYLSGRRKPTGENLKAIGEKLGPEIYDLLGLARPDPDPELRRMQELYDQVPADHREELLRAMEEFLTSHGFRRTG